MDKKTQQREKHTFVYTFIR